MFPAVSSTASRPAVRGLVPFRRPLHSDLPPERAVLWLRGDTRPFALVGDWLGGLTVLGSEPLIVARPDADPFALLDLQPDVGAGAARGGEAAVGGGWIGWLGYGLGDRIERLPPPPPPAVPRAAFSLAFYDHVVVFDDGQWWFEGLRAPHREAALRERLAVWRDRLRAEPPRARTERPTPFRLAGNGAAGHVSAVADCRRRIAAGELFQANLCVRLEAHFAGDPIDLFARALPEARPRFGALVDGAVSLSPERFLRRHGRDVQSEPIKGTRPRVGTEREREAELEALLASAKDAAEHVMIIDLMRNDLGRVCAYGTIGVDPPRPEPHAAVWHLVSTVHGELRPDVGDRELLRACFPPGSVTGAPKVQAMKVIAALEAGRRELYTGAIGIASPLAGLDLNVAIRTFELSGEDIWLGAGGGIVADSDPQAELEEALAKTAGPIAAIGGRLAAPPAGAVRSTPPAPGALHAPGALRAPDALLAPDALRYGLRPDPAAGVFETVLVDRGRAVHLDEHLARLAAALRELYGAELPADLRASVELTLSAASARSRLRLRILAEPDGSVELTLSAASEPPAGPALLAPFTLRGGLGAWKWRDRRLLEVLAARARGTVPLLVDADGLVLEAAHANVWIVEGDELLTPPADGRILPGVTRAHLLGGTPVAREEAIGLERLARADAVFLTSSVSGRQPARLAPGNL